MKLTIGNLAIKIRPADDLMPLDGSQCLVFGKTRMPQAMPEWNMASYKPHLKCWVVSLPWCEVIPEYYAKVGKFDTLASSECVEEIALASVTPDKQHKSGKIKQIMEKTFSQIEGFFYKP